MRIYITHCCAKKDNSAAQTTRKVTPDNLYTATPTKRFMQRCKDAGVRWAIFSDHYGVWFSDEEREWYGDELGDPNRVTETRFIKLLENFDKKFGDFSEGLLLPQSGPLPLYL